MVKGLDSRRVSRAAMISLAFATLLFGCSGGGGGGTSFAPLGTGLGGGVGTTTAPGGTGATTSDTRGEAATARFHVDVNTRQVTVSLLAGGHNSRVKRAVLAGTALTFASSVLVDDAGDVGRKAITVSMTNRRGDILGQMPDGTTTGMRVLLSEFTNVIGLTTDLRSKVTVSALASSLNGPRGAAADNGGNVYVTEFTGNRIKKVSGAVVSTLAGSGTQTSADGAGTAASFNHPFGIALNPVDRAFIVADFDGQKVRRVTSDGVVTTIAGTGAAGATNGVGGSAKFTNPCGAAVSSSGVIYVSEAGGHRVRKIVLTGSGSDPRLAASYTVSTLAGSGTAGSGDAVGVVATFNGPRGVAVDPSGVVYVADTGNNKVRRISSTGEVVTIGGTGVAGNLDGTAEEARFNAPNGVAFLNGTLLVSDTTNGEVRQMTLKAGGNASPTWASSWQVATLAGGVVNSPLDTPSLLAGDVSGNVLVADFGNNQALKLTPTNGFFPIGQNALPGNLEIPPPPTEQVQLSNADGVIPNSGYGSNLPFIAYPQALNSGATSATKKWAFIIPSGVFAFEFTVLVEANTDTLAPPEAASGSGSPNVLVRTYAGAAGLPSNQLGFQDGPAAQARFFTISGVAVDRSGNLFVADSENYAIRRVSASGFVSTVAGVVGMGGGSTDGLGTVAQFSRPHGVAVSSDGQLLFVADFNNNKIRRIALTGGNAMDPVSWTVSTIAGTGVSGASDGPGNTATLNHPVGITLDPGGNVYVTEAIGNRVRRLQLKGGDASVAANWQVSLVAGDNSGASGASGNTDGTGTAARFNSPGGIATDRTGILYVADSSNNRIRKITNPGGSQGGTVTTLAGSTFGYADGTGAAAQFSSTSDVAVDSAGFIYVVDYFNFLIRRVSPTGVVTTVAGTPGIVGETDGAGNVATLFPNRIAVDVAGNLYITDGGDRIRLIQRMISAGTAVQASRVLRK